MSEHFPATMRHPAAVPTAATNWRLQRRCACGQRIGDVGEDRLPVPIAPVTQRASSTDAQPVVPSLVHDVLRSPGQPLDRAAAAFMASRSGQDFSRVRVHTDAKAATSAQAVNALAYTVGRHIVFDAGAYAPTSPSGQRLLAHELTHVVQQGHRPYVPGVSLSLGPENSPDEREADRVADTLVGDGVTSPACAVHAHSPHLAPTVQRAVRFRSTAPLSIDQWDGGGTAIAGDLATMTLGTFAASAEVRAEADAAGEFDNWEVGFLQNDRVTWSRAYWSRDNGDGRGRFLERKLRVPTTPLRDHANDAIVWAAPGEFEDVSTAAGGALSVDIVLSSTDEPAAHRLIHGSRQTGADASDSNDNLFQFRQGDNFISFISAHNTVTDEWRHLDLVYWSVQDSVDFAPDPAGGVTTTRDDHAHGRSRRFQWTPAADQPAIGATLANDYVNDPANTTVRRVNGWT